MSSLPALPLPLAHCGDGHRQKANSSQLGDVAVITGLGLTVCLGDDVPVCLGHLDPCGRGLHTRRSEARAVLCQYSQALHHQQGGGVCTRGGGEKGREEGG